ncbi:hypothetical protein V6N13_148342 [Hibiscus sabdariffa]|uniref:Uncharacterized protein n=1 Tax=Hibiscus sabdariffa TaxID=183260 RepID=A0ABR2TY92_9ROSI
MKEQSPTAMASTKDSVYVPIEELKSKEKDNEYLKMELGKDEALELEMSEQEASFHDHELKDELNWVKPFDLESDLLSADKERIKELHEEIKKIEESEQMIYVMHSWLNPKSSRNDKKLKKQKSKHMAARFLNLLYINNKVIIFIKQYCENIW